MSAIASVGQTVTLISVSLLLGGCAFVTLHQELAEFSDITRRDENISQAIDWNRLTAFAQVPNDVGATCLGSNEERSKVIAGLKTASAEPEISAEESLPLPHFGRRELPHLAGGGLVGLDAPRFDASYGEMGLWRPLTFLREAGAGVYFLDPYDKAKVPILFVHGAGGTPRNWSTFIEHLDRSRYQPWVYYYPTGLALDLTACWLNRQIEELHGRLGFEHLIVTAHSMGGLVARRFIVLNTSEQANNYIDTLVTLATPWDGVASAKLGTVLAPCVMPSWIDVAPGSSFLRSLRSASWPSQVRHHLFFDYRIARNLASSGSDGVVSVRSQLDQRIQVQATGVYGFSESHAGILTSPEVLALFAGVLEFESLNGTHSVAPTGTPTPLSRATSE